MSEYKVTVRDFANRTLKNLITIEQLANENPTKYYEVTQLINSSIGLLFFPQQEFYNSFGEVDIVLLKQRGWPIPVFEYGGSNIKTLRDLIRYMRNSFAHFNIDVKPDGGKTAGIYLWNRDRNSKIDWLCYISIEDLREIFRKFSSMISDKCKDTYRELKVADIRAEIRNVS